MFVPMQFLISRRSRRRNEVPEEYEQLMVTVHPHTHFFSETAQ
jgi:hypothetical protein